MYGVDKMEKGVLLGIQKKNRPNIQIKKRRKKKFLEKLVDYLKYDSYMYALLISSLPSICLPPNTIKSSPTEPIGYLKRATEAISARKLSDKNEQTAKEKDHSNETIHLNTGGVGKARLESSKEFNYTVHHSHRKVLSASNVPPPTPLVPVLVASNKRK